ncbi:MAG: hypothetical protein CMJ25_27710 [Phycisphaerae bacterium]|nr:hypothetical protein [Phycisphaerae bacterium]
MAKSKTKAEIQAELDEAEQRAEAAEKEAAEAKAKAEAAERAAAQQQSAGNAKTPAPSADGRTKFVSRFKRYRVPGAQFDNFRFSTDDPELIKKLQAHSAYGNEFRIEAAATVD